MRKTKKLLSVLLVVCMIVPMAIAAVVPATAGVVTGGGIVAADESGVFYRFSDLSWVPSVNLGRDYTTGDGIVLYVFNNRYYFSNDDEGNLVATDNTEDGDNYFEMTFQSGFAHPTEHGTNYFFDVDALAIRYKILNNTENVGGTATLSVAGGNSTAAYCDSFAIPENDVWVETVYTMTATGAGYGFGYWTSDPATAGNEFEDPDTNKFKFPTLSSGASIVIDYIGLYHSVEEANAGVEAAQKQLKGIPAVDVPSGNIYEDSKTITVTPVDGTTVYYTTDGSDPTTNGTVYTNPITITVDTCLKVAPYFTATEKFGSVYTYNYHFSPDLTYTYNDPNVEVTQSTKAHVIRFNGVKYVSGYDYTMDNELTITMPPHRTYSNDADGNLVVSLSSNGGWNTTCFGDKHNSTISAVMANVIEVRYKATDASGAARPIGDFEGNVSINDMAGVAVTSNTTSDDGNGWFVTRIVYGASTLNKFSDTWDLLMPEVVGGTITIDYIGFFRDENVADAHGKFDDVCDGEKVTFYGAQKKLDGNGVRFIGVIDDYTDTDYAEFGFKVQVGTEIVDAKIEKYVYDGFVDGDTTVKIEDAVTVAGENTKFFTFCVNDIPNDALVDGSITFTVCAYAKINGTAAYGSTSTFVYTPATSTLVAA